MRLAKSACLVAMFSLVFALPAAADPFVTNFCPGDSTCPLGVTEASLTFAEILNGDGDPNDYTVTIRISGNASAPAYVDEVSFKIDSAQVNDYEFLPTLLSAPIPGSPWIVYFDTISGSANSCVADTGQQQAVCSQSQNGPGNTPNYGAPLPGQTLTWTFLVDLNDSEGPLSANSPVNLRAQFLTASGKNAGILSPASIPEPSSLTLLGAGLGVLAASLLPRAKSGT